MSNVPYISIKSILYDLADIVPTRYWNEASFLEWAHKGLQRVGTHSKYETALQLVPLLEHEAVLPSDTKYIIQIAYKIDATATDIEELQRIMNLDSVEWNPALTHMQNPTGLATKALAVYTNTLAKTNWRPMRLSTNSFLKSVQCDPSMFPTLYTDINNSDCSQEYTVNADMTLTTSLKDGLLYIAYLRFPKSESGDTLIPNNEELKEALLHYCLWRYWLKKSMIGEENATRERDYHRNMFGLMKAKAQSALDSPDVAQLENLKSQRDRLMPRDNQFSSFFSKLNGKENLRY